MPKPKNGHAKKSAHSDTMTVVPGQRRPSKAIKGRTGQSVDEQAATLLMKAAKVLDATVAVH